MKKSRFSEEQVIGILREAEAGSPIKAVCAAHNISMATYHAFRQSMKPVLAQIAFDLNSNEEEFTRTC